MLIKFLTSTSGLPDPVNGLDRDFSFAPGDLADIADAKAEKWIASGVAVAIPPKPLAKPPVRGAKK